ncbi:MAG: Gfo/Idh/MocA family oxidoreductase, partial [Prevotella sp.]|nr:Gfo/Idh/MocA family oxidoreductase [Prevotella sp.]
MKKLRVGLVGTGMIGKQHADAIGRIFGIELVAITESNKDILEKQKDYFRVNAYSDYKEMIDKEELDVIHNCTPNFLHFEINKYALEKGVHVYSEKPLAVTVAQGEELTKLAKAKGLANGVNFNYRNNAMVQDMRARMKNKDAGRCLLIHGRYVQDWLQYDTDFNWRLETAEGGESRAIADIGSHWFDTVQTVTGKKITAIYARNFISHPTRKKNVAGKPTDVKIETEDGSFILFELEDGTQGSLVVSQVSGGYKNNLFISVDCEKYSMRWDQEQSDRLKIGTRDSGVIEMYASADAVDSSVSRYATLPSGHP